MRQSIWRAIEKSARSCRSHTQSIPSARAKLRPSLPKDMASLDARWHLQSADGTKHGSPVRTGVAELAKLDRHAQCHKKHDKCLDCVPRQVNDVSTFSRSRRSKNWGDELRECCLHHVRRASWNTLGKLITLSTQLTLHIYGRAPASRLCDTPSGGRCRSIFLVLVVES